MTQRLQSFSAAAHLDRRHFWNELDAGSLEPTISKLRNTIGLFDHLVSSDYEVTPTMVPNRKMI